ncbi:MAG: hypothetical protein JSV74_06905 [Dehalococcoidia bacterium]|nr:MAG: hypothetical protein JSV74_06905 [Dehalococcoidia bacterium]
MTERNLELLDILKDINKKLGEIKYNLKDIKNNLPKVPYYGDLLEDIARANKNINK